MPKPPTKYTVPDKDLDWQFFRSGGKGGQNVNKRDTGVRVVHLPSGASGESREERSQHQNRVKALRKLGESRVFKAWCSMQLRAMEAGKRSLAEVLDEATSDENLKIEVGVPPQPGDIEVK